MLKISQMELVGFKSFSEKANLSFSGGVTAVVGPNGCGKSNISDALSWVLGETSAKSLRGARMEDVIFNGSSERKPLGMAEVTMKLEAPSSREGAGPDEVEEIFITRRLFRDGESEYLLDGKRVRRMDIEERLYGHGIDGKAYAIIEQGRIGMILSGRAIDRRLLIEEAAGIHHYKGKKHQAELRLEAATTNLDRIEDIIGEVKRQLGSAKRQASRAERFKELKEAERRIQRILFVKQLRSRRARADELYGGLGGAQERLAEALAAATSTEAELESRREERLGAERTLAAARESLHEVRILLERKEAEGRQLKAELEELEVRAGRAREGISESGGRIEEIQGELVRLGGELEAVESVVTDRDLAFRGAQAGTQAVLARMRERETALEEHRDRLFGVTSALSGVRNEAQKVAALTERARSLEGKHRFELESISVERERLLAAHEEVSRSDDAHRAELARLADEVAHLREEAASLERRLGEESEARQSARAARDECGHRLTSLQDIEERRYTYEEGVRRFFEERADAATLGVVADHLVVEARFEHAVEGALSDVLQSVLVADAEAAVAAAATLPDSGRVTFLPLAGPAGATAVAPVEGTGVLGSLLSLLTLAPAAPETLLGRLASTIPSIHVVEGLDVALRMAAAYPEASFVTLGGEVVRPGGLLVAGRRGTKGILEVKREVRELTERHEVLGRELALREEALAGSQGQARDVDARLRAAQESAREAERRMLVLTHEGQQVVQSLERLDRRQDLLGLELADVVRELGSYQEEAVVLAAREERAAGELRELEEERDRRAAELEQVRAELPTARSAEDDASRALSQAREARAKADAERRSMEARLAEQRRGLDRLEADLDGMQVRSVTCASGLHAAGEAMAELAARQEEASSSVRVADEAFAELGRAEEELHGLLKERRIEHDAAREALGALEIAKAEVEAELKHLAERCRTSLHASLEEIEAAFPLPGAEPEAGEEGIPAERREGEEDAARSEEELLGEVSSLSERIENLGPVNLMAIEEAKELEERHDFLVKQRDDVTRSIEDIRTAIRKINDTSRERFREAFDAINGHFKQAYVELFGGGHAELRLQESEDILEAGVDIVAQPPGKRLQSIMLMSGGEKALSALALLFGIFQYRPSPFCVLDEVDAPLDEANVGRFTSLLRRLQDRTQFILITHNKSTMEIAEQLYGISMDEPGISKVYSVRLGREGEEPRNGNGNGSGHEDEPAQAASGNGNGNGNGHGANGNGHGANGKGSGNGHHDEAAAPSRTRPRRRLRSSREAVEARTAAAGSAAPESTVADDAPESVPSDPDPDTIEG